MVHLAFMEFPTLCSKTNQWALPLDLEVFGLDYLPSMHYEHSTDVFKVTEGFAS